VGSIANNLNPGVYYVTGDSACNASTATYCSSVTFSGNTMNANFGDVQDRCWQAPNNPQLDLFTAPCPDGFVYDPTAAAVSDPQCSGSAQLPLAPPSFTLVASAAGGSLDPVGTGSRYFVRVTALDAMGETTSHEQSVVVTSAAHTGSIAVAITAVAGASGYNIYVSAQADAVTATTGNDELLYASTTTVAPATTSVTATGSGTTYPVFDTSSCSTGFRNIPKSSVPAQQDGVTFVLLNKASICLDTSCNGSGGSTPLVLLSPYCSGYRYSSLPAPIDSSTGGTLPVVSPPVPAGTACPYINTGAFMNDGAFEFYAPLMTGRAAAYGNGARWGMSGTLFAPGAELDIQSNAQLAVICGQGIFRTVNIQTGNKLNPAFYWPCANSAGARPAPVVKLVR
jgi:hypothetical protein